MISSISLIEFNKLVTHTISWIDTSSSSSLKYQLMRKSGDTDKDKDR